MKCLMEFNGSKKQFVLVNTALNYKVEDKEEWQNELKCIDDGCQEH